jgi:signal transduction histidine kinase
MMKRATDKLIALQFLAVAMPLAVVLLSQLVIDARRATYLENARPFRILAAEARGYYTIFMNGAADVADTGSLGKQAAEALHSTAGELAALAILDDSAKVGNAAAIAAELEASVEKGATLRTLAPLAARIAQGDELTRDISEEYERRDEMAVREAVASGIRQKYAVACSLVITTVFTIVFVMATRRRLKAKVEAEISAERKRRAELETMSVRFDVATRAARAGVYELKEDGLNLWWSDSMYELYAQSPQTFAPTVPAWLELIHADDREAMQAAIEGAMRDHSQLRSQYCVVRPDGTVRHIASMAAVVTDTIDKVPRLVGIDLDITERVESDERERQLQNQLRDASRQAGMAEVATNVLHNIGNVLNSVNISASVVSEKLRESKSASLGKVAALLREHETDLGTFISNDERGKHLPRYLAELAEQLARDQSVSLQELELLRRNVEHIKDIVMMQQSYSKLVGVPEKLAVANLVNDALRMNAGAFTRHGVSVKCDYESVPEIVAEKHKILQILVNLLRNAKYACEASEKAEKQVVIKIAKKPDGVQLAVSDNGIGIHPEHMPRIFTHGFTTKKDGHGFGLHSGALAAKELGGALWVDSAGPGLGATFTLDLPFKCPEVICE